MAGKLAIMALAAVSVCQSNAFTSAPSIRSVAGTLGHGPRASSASSDRICDTKKPIGEEIAALDPSRAMDADLNIKKSFGKKQATDCRYFEWLPPPVAELYLLLSPLFYSPLSGELNRPTTLTCVWHQFFRPPGILLTSRARKR